MDLKEICSSISSIAIETGRYIMSESGEFNPGTAEKKAVNDFVTHVDKGAESFIVAELSKLLPEAGFIVEEKTSVKRGERYNWVVDPLDGTTNFIHKLHPFAISIALTEYGEPVAGVVHEAAGNESFSAWKGGGAWLNSERIYVSTAARPQAALVSTGFPYKDFSRLDGYLHCLTWMMKNTMGIRRMGAASIDLAYVACGRFEVFFEYGLNPWDIAAGALLVREAGGTVTDFKGAGENLTGADIIASNHLLYPEFHKIISNFMVK
ncbi:MAG: inositol monophosphatase family protein [Bacteroidales bacterium]